MMEERQDYELSEEMAPEDEAVQPRVQRNFIVPDSKTKLLACERCRLLKTENQWKMLNSCDNCGNLKDSDYKKYTTSKFEGMTAFMDVSKSWLRKKLNLSKNLVPGMYAIDLH